MGGKKDRARIRFKLNDPPVPRFKLEKALYLSPFEIIFGQTDLAPATSGNLYADH